MVSATSVFFESMPCKVRLVQQCREVSHPAPGGPLLGLIDYPALERNAKQPKMNVAGIGCYPRKLDYARYSAVVHCTAVLHCTAHCSQSSRRSSGCGGGARSPYQVLDHGN